ncbi:MAG: helix-hairpin-helix domain-containing protein, partial [Dehalococcoidales bacterium]
MTATRYDRFWTLIIVLLVVITVTGALLAWIRYRPDKPIEITVAPHQDLQEQIYIGGAVANPGFYPLKNTDTIQALIQAGGGTTDGADITQLELLLYITDMDEQQEPQKIDINRAEIWLLEALPGIGESKAQAIVNYRQQTGAFHNM